MKVCSIFSQVLKLFSCGGFEKVVKQHKAERHARGFTSWGQFMAMLFCQVGRAHSLREVCGGLACCEGQLKHLGVPVAPKRSTLAYANEHRPWELYQTVFEQTLSQRQELVRSQGGRKKFRFKNKLMSLDGSIIDLSVSMFDWAKFRRPDEVLGLRREDIDLERGQLHIRNGKSPAARRTLDLTSESRQILSRRREGKSPWIFPSQRTPGKRLTRLNGAHDRLCARAVEKGVSLKFVLYKHTFATRMAQAGVDLLTLAAILGHSSIRIVQRYVHPTADHKRAAMERYDESLRAGRDVERRPN